ncbi:MAG: phosphatase PAP2 family protein [Chthoniobacterales bacterium]
MILGFWIFAEIAEDIQPHGTMLARDHAVTNWFHAHATPGLTTAARAITTFGSVAFLCAASLGVVILLVWKKAWHRLIIFASGMVGGSLLNILLKHFFHRHRPILENPLVTLSSYGFPSGHTMGATTFYGLLVLLTFASWQNRSRRVLAILLAGLFIAAIGLTRIYLGAHFMTDVLAAGAAGAVWLAFCWSAGETLKKFRRK